MSRIHHKITTFLPPQNTQKSQNPLQNRTSPTDYFFSARQLPQAFWCLTDKEENRGNLNELPLKVVLPSRVTQP
jgi:hypothetical protein